LEDATANVHVDRCLKHFLPPVEKSVNALLDAMAASITNTPEITELFRITREAWTNYRNIQCRMEEALAAGGQVRGLPPLPAIKAFGRCLLRVTEEYRAHLSASDEYLRNLGDSRVPHEREL
jgi:hypothetical protein